MLDAARETRGIVTAEEAIITGGLGAAVAQPRRAAPARPDAHPRRHRIRPHRQHRATCSTTSASPPTASPRPPMSSPDHILAIDQGTSATKAVLVDATGAIVARGARPRRAEHPAAGLGRAGRERDLGVRPGRGRGVPERRGSEPRRRRRPQHPARVAAAVGPRDRASRAARCSAGRTSARPRLRAGCASTPTTVRALSGLPLDPMFSATKARWLLDALRRATAPASAPSTRCLLVQARRRATSSRPATPRAPSCSTCATATGRRRCSTLFERPARRAAATWCPSTGPFPGVRGLAAAAGRHAGRAP